jgi:hypothetical protein
MNRFVALDRVFTGVTVSQQRQQPFAAHAIAPTIFPIPPDSIELAE